MPITGNMNSRNFITKITTYEKICSIPNSMTVLPELLPKVLDMMKNNLTGTLNLTNPGLISHNEILDMFINIVDKDFKYKNFSLEEQSKILDSDRSNNFLDTSKLKKLYPDVKNIKEYVKDCLIKYKNTYIKKHKKELTNNNNILITGGCGFIGSNFINYFYYNKNYNIINLDKLHYCAKIENVKKEIRESNRYKLIVGDINSEELVKNILNDYNIKYVIHFAAQSHVDNSFTNSKQYTIDNVCGTHNLLECSRIYNKLEKFIHVSTDEVYGESMLDENKKLNIQYYVLQIHMQQQKAAAELIAQSYNHSYNMPIIITRGNNVYGPNQYPEKLIPKFIKLLKENKKVTIHGDGTDFFLTFI